MGWYSLNYKTNLVSACLGLVLPHSQLLGCQGVAGTGSQRLQVLGSELKLGELRNVNALAEGRSRQKLAWYVLSTQSWEALCVGKHDRHWEVKLGGRGAAGLYDASPLVLRIQEPHRITGS